MSVDYYVCDNCNTSRYSENARDCESCGRTVCDDCAIGNPNFYHDHMNENGELQQEYCPFCSGDNFTEADLLYAALEKLGMTRDELEKELKERNKQ